jgi:pre-60S factor REI1
MEAKKEEEEWEDIVSDDDEDVADTMDDDDDDDDDEEMYRGYEEEVARMGFNVTVLGELVFPDGRIIGHRALRRYYKQRLPTPQQQHTTTGTAVAAARHAAGERLYRGRVYNIGYNNCHPTDVSDTSNNRALALAGIAPGLAAGRAGKGLLVPTTTTAAAGMMNMMYSQVSVYRYRAAVRKQRRGEWQGQQLHQRTATNMNRMDKKANRLMNGVSVAHAKR